MFGRVCLSLTAFSCPVPLDKLSHLTLQEIDTRFLKDEVESV